MTHPNQNRIMVHLHKKGYISCDQINDHPEQTSAFYCPWNITKSTKTRVNSDFINLIARARLSVIIPAIPGFMSAGAGSPILTIMGGYQGRI